MWCGVVYVRERERERREIQVNSKARILENMYVLWDIQLYILAQLDEEECLILHQWL